jgi:hypothetical protein
MKYLSVMALMVLVACGADGAPTPPAGVTVSGEAQMGVTGTIEE